MKTAPYSPTTSLTLDPPTLELQPNGSGTLAATRTPDDAVPIVFWESSDDGVATVDGAGNVTAIAEGTATITATSRQGGRPPAPSLPLLTTAFLSSFSGPTRAESAAVLRRFVEIVLPRFTWSRFPCWCWASTPTTGRLSWAFGLAGMRAPGFGRGVLNDLKSRGVKEVSLFCVNGLSGLRESIAAEEPSIHGYAAHTWFFCREKGRHGRFPASDLTDKAVFCLCHCCYTGFSGVRILKRGPRYIIPLLHTLELCWGT